MPEYLLVVRNIRKGNFGSEPGRTRFLKTPTNSKEPKISHAIAESTWRREVMKIAESGTNPETGKPCGDVLIFIHGYNNSPRTILGRHQKIRKGLEQLGYKGAVVSFDWPCDTTPLNYLEDRSDAKQTAIRLVDHGIKQFARIQSDRCEINVHLLAHSTGAYVIREAFDDADDRSNVASFNWTVSQVMFIGGDVSSKSMRTGDSKSSSLYRHCVRLTNYSNPFDSVLKLSNTKRIGVAPRVGRIGLPDEIPLKAVNVNCGPYFEKRYKTDLLSTKGHSWYLDDPGFMKDLFYTVSGDLDREVIPTRSKSSEGLLLKA